MLTQASIETRSTLQKTHFFFSPTRGWFFPEHSRECFVPLHTICVKQVSSLCTESAEVAASAVVVAFAFADNHT